ncbi:protein pxr1-like [Willisornis vidua]|uniref:Protein pxr1-like n=1 Tax=Willisornis vidua TaxID=1566151 RepID=A0ABQ9DHV7_9PASS|nr:protein pxr1-like [Willisornis vidua]
MGREKVTAQCENNLGKRGVTICERSSPAHLQASEEGGGGDAPSARAEIPLQPLVKTMVRQAVLVQPLEVHDGAAAGCGQPHVRGGECLKEIMTPFDDCTGVIRTYGPVAPDRTYGPVEQGAYARAASVASLISRHVKIMTSHNYFTSKKV